MLAHLLTLLALATLAVAAPIRSPVVVAPTTQTVTRTVTYTNVPSPADRRDPSLLSSDISTLLGSDPESALLSDSDDTDADATPSGSAHPSDVDAVAADSPGASDAILASAGTAPTSQIVAAYYPDWAGAAFPPEKIDFARFDWIDFAFALPDATFALTWDNPDGTPALLRRLVTAAHAAGKKVKLSVGGWTGSRYFSTAIATDASRLIFATNILSTYELFSLDGIDIDYEYPGQPGAPGNRMDSARDAANFLSFLQLLRTVLPPGAVITAAALDQPWVGANGTPLADASAFAAALDWILLMNYDVWGSSSTPGPNAPLSDTCGTSTQPGASAAAAVHAWTAAGFPASKLTLGLPSYGYLSRSSARTLRNRRDVLTLANADGGSDGGQIQFRALVEAGALAPDPAQSAGAIPRTFAGARGFERGWDACSSTPFIHSSTVGQVITYDDPSSLALKAAFAAQQGLRGVNLFSINGDTDEWDLVDAVRQAFLVPA